MPHFSVERGENSTTRPNPCNLPAACSVIPAMTLPTDEDTELDRQWREAFGQPLPMLGAAKIARNVLQQYRQQTIDNPDTDTRMNF